MVKDDDSALVEAALGGDGEAFGELVRRYQGPIFNLAARITGSADDAMDVAQTTFLKAYDRLESFDPSRRFFSWLYGIGVHEALNWRQRQGGRDAPLPIRFDPPSGAADPEHELATKQREARFASALARLQPSDRAVLSLRHFQELGYADIARMLDCSVGQVKSRLFDARRRLRAAWLDGGGDR
jgi:RNA polymerase sigma-70 factor (ECF subfamily)